MRTATGGRGPLVSHRGMPRAGTKIAAAAAAIGTEKPRVVYFASCAGQMFGPARDDRSGETVAATLYRLLDKAGFEIDRAGSAGQPLLRPAVRFERGLQARATARPRRRSMRSSKPARMADGRSLSIPALAHSD